MSGALRYVGAICIVVCAFLLSRSYSSYIKRRVSECECFLLLISHVEKMIRCFLSPVSDIFSKFECNEAKVMSFVCGVRDGKALSDAFAECECELALGKDGKKILSELFSELGRGYKDGTLSLVASARSELEKYTAREREEGEKNLKLATALLVGGAVGVVLLFL